MSVEQIKHAKKIKKPNSIAYIPSYMMFDTGHAVSMTTSEGAELLIHYGVALLCAHAHHAHDALGVYFLFRGSDHDLGGELACLLDEHAGRTGVNAEFIAPERSCR